MPLGDANGAGYPFNGALGQGRLDASSSAACSSPAWSTYGFETAVCYTSELTNPGTDTFKAIFFSGILCLVIFILVPFTFQGALGVKAMLDPGIYDGSGVAKAMASMFGTAGVIYFVMVILLILALVLSIITAMAGSSRTLYQGSVDGWLPKYLSYVNDHGAPTRAMWTDLCFNLILLMMSNYLFILAVSNCLYIIFNFINLNSGWLHRIDSGHVRRPWRAPELAPGARRRLRLREHVLHGGGRQYLRLQYAAPGHHRGGTDHPDLHLPPLHPGQWQMAVQDADRPRHQPRR